MQLLGRGGSKGQMEKANLQSKRQSPAKQKAQALTKVECGYPKEGGTLVRDVGVRSWEGWWSLERPREIKGEDSIWQYDQLGVMGRQAGFEVPKATGESGRQAEFLEEPTFRRAEHSLFRPRARIKYKTVGF